MHGSRADEAKRFTIELIEGPGRASGDGVALASAGPLPAALFRGHLIRPRPAHHIIGQRPVLCKDTPKSVHISVLRLTGPAA